MNEIEIAENKTLKLNNVLHRPINQDSEEGLEKVMRMFDSYLKSNKLEPYGPAIVRSESTISNGKIIQKSDMLVQLRSPPAIVTEPYGFQPSLRMENCLMARFRGPMSALQIAYSKMQVYSFEHDIRPSGTTFTVFVEHSPDGIVLADIFSEVIG